MSSVAGNPPSTGVEAKVCFVESSYELSSSLRSLRVASKVSVIKSEVEEEENTLWTCTPW